MIDCSRALTQDLRVHIRKIRRIRILGGTVRVRMSMQIVRRKKCVLFVDLKCIPPTLPSLYKCELFGRIARYVLSRWTSPRVEQKVSSYKIRYAS